VEELRERTGPRTVRLRVDGDHEALAASLRAQTWTETVERSGSGLRVAVSSLEEAQRGIPRIIAECGVGLVRFEAEEATLEDVFVELVGQGGAARPGPGEAP